MREAWNLWMTCGGLMSLTVFSIILAATLIRRRDTLIIDMPEERPGYNLMAFLCRQYGINAEAYRMDGHPDQLFVEVQPESVEKAIRVLTSLGYNPRKERDSDERRVGANPAQA